MKDAGPMARRAALDAQDPNVLAVREVGGNNKGPSVAKYLASCNIHEPAAWCAAFCHYRLHQAARELGLSVPDTFTPTAYTPDWRAWAVNNKLWTPVSAAKEAPVHSVQVGDMALFYFASMGRIGHIGIVTGLLKNDDGDVVGVRTVEGNTGPDKGDAVERAGDGVYAKKRLWAQLGARGGFARLPF